VIHIIRENERLEDIADIYGVDRQSIVEANNAIEPVANRAIWVPAAFSIMFAQRNMFITDVAREANTDTQKVYELNGNRSVYEKNQRIRLPGAEAQSFKLFSLCQAGFGGARFLDESSACLSGVFVDSYPVTAGRLSIKDDFFPVSCSLFYDTSPGFVAASPNALLRGGNLAALLGSLQYKEYRCALLTVSGAEGAAAYEKLRDNLFGFGLDIYVRGDEDALEAIGDSNRVEAFFYQPRCNAFDYPSFELAMSRLACAFPEGKLGYVASMCAADVNKATNKATYPEMSQVDDIIRRERIKSLYFDDETQLCFLQYTKSGQVHNVVFEDMRSLYAKTHTLHAMGVQNLLIEKPVALLDAVAQL